MVDKCHGEKEAYEKNSFNLTIMKGVIDGEKEANWCGTHADNHELWVVSQDVV